VTPTREKMAGARMGGGAGGQSAMKDGSREEKKGQGGSMAAAADADRLGKGVADAVAPRRKEPAAACLAAEE
jgi:hypothetical protein